MRGRARRVDSVLTSSGAPRHVCYPAPPVGRRRTRVIRYRPGLSGCSCSCRSREPRWLTLSRSTTALRSDDTEAVFDRPSGNGRRSYSHMLKSDGGCGHGASLPVSSPERRRCRRDCRCRRAAPSAGRQRTPGTYGLLGSSSATRATIRAVGVRIVWCAPKTAQQRDFTITIDAGVGSSRRQSAPPGRSALRTTFALQAQMMSAPNHPTGRRPSPLTGQ